MAGLYIHIPFCAKKCRYCDFISFVEENDVMEKYIRAVSAELRLVSLELPKRKYDTVFIGGGTPSILKNGAMTALFASVRKHLCVADDAEITIECNPGTLDADKLREYRSVGINRLSMGLQSANDDILREIGRIHTYSDFQKSYDAAREAGFCNINADVMYALPAQSEADVIATIDKLAKLGLEHISAYSLILEENTPLYMDVNSGVTLLPGEDAEYKMHRAVIERLKHHGYKRYEISNYCSGGFESRHNLNYWNNGEYLGVGLNSHSALNMPSWTRYNNVASLDAYFAAVESGRLPVAEKNEIPRDEEMFESVMLGFRKTDGISTREFKARFGVDFCNKYETAIKELVKLEWLAFDGERFMLTDAGLDMQNEALMYFMED